MKFNLHQKTIDKAESLYESKAEAYFFGLVCGAFCFAIAVLFGLMVARFMR